MSNLTLKYIYFFNNQVIIQVLTLYKASLILGCILLYSSTPLIIKSSTSFILNLGLYRSVLASSSEMLEMWRASIIPAVTTPLSCSIKLLNNGCLLEITNLICKVVSKKYHYIAFKTGSMMTLMPKFLFVNLH